VFKTTLLTLKLNPGTSVFVGAVLTRIG